MCIKCVKNMSTQTLPSSDVTIRVDHVSKLFRRQKQRTFKEMLPALIRHGKGGVVDTFWALKDITFDVHRGEAFGIIGPNGSGKSTLLKLIANVSQPTSGTVEVSGRITPLIELGAGFHADMTGRENIYLNASILGLTKKQTEPLIQKIIDFSEIGDFIDEPVKHYSSGMYTRLAFSVAVHVPFDVLLVDEILSVGDARFQHKCIELMQDFKKNGKTILYVGHGLTQVEKICDRAAFINYGDLVCVGKPLDVIRRYAEHLGIEYQSVDSNDD